MSTVYHVIFDHYTVLYVTVYMYSISAHIIIIQSNNFL